MKLKFLSVITLFTICFQANSQTKVRGKILPKASYSLDLHVYDLEKDSYIKQRTLTVSDNGKFNFETPNSPNLYKLFMNGKSVTFINDNDKHIDINIDFTSQSPITFNGSLASQQLLEYNNLVRSLQIKLLYPLEPLMKEALKENDKNKISEIEQKHKENLKIFINSLMQKINSMGSSLAVYAIIIDLDFNKYLEGIESLYQKFVEDKPKSRFTVKLGELINNAKLLRIEKTAPSFTLETVNSGKISLSELNSSGKTVLLDFWASWCLPCRKENRELKEMITQYDPSKFIIWSVSTDKDKEAWKKAMKKDDMPWFQSRTTDPKIIELYQAITLPTNFLIDQNGIIKAKNIKAVDLKKELNKILEK